MRPTLHIAASLSVAALLWLLTRSACGAALCVVSGVLIDVDHVLEYVLRFGWRDLRLVRVYRYYDSAVPAARRPGDRPPYFFLHANEVAILLWLVTLLTRDACLLGLTLGYTVHLLLDIVGDRRKGFGLSYFFLRRLLG